MPEIIIRIASDDDTAELLDIFNNSRLALGCYPDASMSMADFSVLIAEEEIYVATDNNGEIMGFAGIWVPDNFIHHLYVLPDKQGQGTGTKLLNKCVETYGLPLTLKCDQINVAGHSFYEHYGFKAISTGEGDYGTWVEYAIS